MSDPNPTSTRRAVAVGAERVEDRERISGIARSLGIPVVEGAPRDGRATIGDAVLPEDAADWYLEAALVRALEPRHILFLCVANSARSQLAEGIASFLATKSGSAVGSSVGREATGRKPIPVKISSAGSEPTSVRPQAIEVLAEIGIDISDQRSNGVDEVEGPVDVVITLCEEEVCPVWLEEAVRVHWGLPDPAGSGTTEEEHIQAFRDVRDELRTRLHVLFTGRPL